ncbi:MAG: hypothetical protein JST04_11415 [Bdellovibrionales bacterium]|nr:hypothetical protein [Bdellovibrionales bacterium]
MGRIRTTTIFVCALSLSGCFNNMSGLDDETGSTRNAQSNSTLNDTGFASEVGPIDTAAVMIGTYYDTSGSQYGLMIDLYKSLLATVGAASLQAILDGIDTNTTMQARQVTVHIPAFGIQATTTLGKIAAGNNKKLRNVMNIRPGLGRIDLTTSALEVPGSPHVRQLGNANKTVITYGGRIETDYVRRMTVLIPFAGQTAGFLPSVSVPNFGDGYPAASPEEYSGSVDLLKVTSQIATRFGKIITNPPYGTSIFGTISSDAIKSINQTYNSLALAVHYKYDPATGGPHIITAAEATPTVDLHGVANNKFEGQAGFKQIEAAYLININPANNSGPETFPLCHEGYDSQDQAFGWGGANSDGYDTEFSHPLACNCTVAETLEGTMIPATATLMPASTIFVDPCPALPQDRIPALIESATSGTSAIAVSSVNGSPNGPTSGNLNNGMPRTVNDFVLDTNH